MNRNTEFLHPNNKGANGITIGEYRHLELVKAAITGLLAADTNRTQTAATLAEDAVLVADTTFDQAFQDD